MTGFISELSILFRGSRCLYCTALIIIALLIEFEIRELDASSFVVLSQDALSFQTFVVPHAF